MLKTSDSHQHVPGKSYQSSSSGHSNAMFWDGAENVIKSDVGTSTQSFLWSATADCMVNKRVLEGVTRSYEFANGTRWACASTRSDIQRQFEQWCAV